MPYKMKNGSYRAHKMINGRRKTKTFKTKKEAKAWESSQTEENWLREETGTTSLAEWATSYLDMATERFSRKTYEEKRTVFSRFFKVVDSGTDAREMSLQLAHRYLGLQARARSGHAANKDRKNLMAAWNWGVRFMGLPERNPFRMVECYPEEREPKYVPPEEHMQRILENETGEVRVFLLAMLHTAARRSELLSLRWSDLDFERRTVRLGTRKRKGGDLEYDQIPMTETLYRALSEHMRRTSSVYVFSNEDGQPFTARQHLMKRVCKRNNVPYFSFHAIRHLAASMMDRAGVELATIQAILRHQAATTTSRYLHSLRGVKVELDGVFQGQKQGRVLEMKRAPEEGSSEAQ